MRTYLTLTLLALATLPNLGCLGCSAYAGGGDTVFQRGAESLILCENGGFVANVTAGAIEGHYHAQAPAGTTYTGFGTRGDNGQLAFDLTENPDGTAITTELGDAPWTNMTASMNQVELDHANIQCTDLVNRSWWAQP
jgi:hypothetical protein